MGRDRYRILDGAAHHFLTCTVLEWLPLFAQPANAQILLHRPLAPTLQRGSKP